ncbi:putative peptidoglycan binding domain-containing protein [Halobacteriaceae archaeon GCM10025711]
MFKLYDVTLLERERPDEFRELRGETATNVAGVLTELGFDAGAPGPTLGDAGRDALEEFRGMNNFENHSLEALEDAIARGWGDAEGTGERRLVDAIWRGLSAFDRK